MNKNALVIVFDINNTSKIMNINLDDMATEEYIYYINGFDLFQLGDIILINPIASMSEDKTIIINCDNEYEEE